MNIDLNTWAKCCVSCQTSKVYRQTKAPEGTIKILPGRFEHIHIDLVGSLVPSGGCTYILTVIERFTRWTETNPLSSIPAQVVAETLFTQNFSRFGIPHTIKHDQGTQFESILFSEFTKFLGCHQIHTTTYHPRSNGMIERFHRTVKAYLTARGSSIRWKNELPVVLLGLRASVKEDLQCSSAELVYGQPLRLPAEFFTQSHDTLSPFLY